MARPWRVRYAGAKYHVTVRGNGRQPIFLAEEDRARFLEQLASVNHRWLALMEQGGMGANRRAYGKYIAQLLGADDDELRREKEASRYAIGDERFRGQVERDVRDVQEHNGVYGDIV